MSLPNVDLSRIVADLQTDRLYEEPACIALIRLATLGGRLPLQSAMQGLSAFERALMLEAFGAGEARFQRAAANETVGAHAFQDRFGRIRLHRTREEGAECCADATPIGFIAIDASALDRAEETEHEAQLIERAHMREIDEVFARWQADGSLGDRVRDAAAWVDRVETVLMFDDHGFHSRSDLSSNTLLRDGHLLGLAGKEPAAWTAGERVLVVSLHMLFITGRAVRFEEFNGRQLTATALVAWLRERALCYASALGDDAAVPARLEDLAEYVRDASRRVDASRYVRYRRIDGVTLRKRERLVPLQRGLRWESGAERVAEVEARTVQALESSRRRGDAAPLERIFEDLVLEAATAGRADYAMSSGVRNLAQAVAEPDTHAGLLGLNKKDFFCCVMPTEGFARRYERAVLERVLYSVAQRMEFNRWHFIVGNLDPSTIPPKRHFYYPPLMPDVAEWSDVWHPGHTAAGVRYTLRAPGPALWRDPLQIAGLALRGCLDMRLVRTEGPPFTIDDLAATSRYSTLIDVVWRVIARDVEANGALPAITAYDRVWYDQARWTAAAEPAPVPSETTAGEGARTRVYGDVLQSA